MKKLFATILVLIGVGLVADALHFEHRYWEPTLEKPAYDFWYFSGEKARHKAPYIYDFEIDGLYYHILSEDPAEVALVGKYYVKDFVWMYIDTPTPDYDYWHHNVRPGVLELPDEVEWQGKKYTLTVLGYGCLAYTDATIERIPSGVREVHDGALIGVHVENIRFEQPTRIAHYGIKCDDIKRADLSNVTGKYYGMDFSNLEELILPATLDRFAGWSCPPTTCIFRSLCEVPQYDSKMAIEIFKHCTEHTLYVPAGSVELYRNTPGWNQFGKILADPASVSVVRPEESYILDGRTLRSADAFAVYDISGRCAGVLPGELTLSPGIYILGLKHPKKIVVR